MSNIALATQISLCRSLTKHHSFCFRRIILQKLKSGVQPYQTTCRPYAKILYYRPCSGIRKRVLSSTASSQDSVVTMANRTNDMEMQCATDWGTETPGPVSGSCTSENTPVTATGTNNIASKSKRTTCTHQDDSFTREGNQTNTRMQVKTGQKMPNDGSSRRSVLDRMTNFVRDGKQPPSHFSYREKKGSDLALPSGIDIQVLATGAEGTEKAFIVAMDHFRYLFNCGEGTQRLLLEHRCRISKITDVFFTHTSWENIGGLMGLVLSLESAGIPSLRLHGPVDCQKVLGLSEFFTNRITIDIFKQEVAEEKYTDSAMEIEYILLTPSSTTTEDAENPIHERKDVSVAYYCLPHKKQRSVIIQKCFELGVPVGPLVGVLKNGGEITLDDGRVIKPDDVLSPEEALTPFLVVECPTEDYLDSLLSHPRLQSPEEDVTQPHLIVHLSPPDVFSHSKYQKWINSFPVKVKHIVINKNGTPVAYEGVFQIQARLNLLHQDVFPLLPLQINWQQPALFQTLASGAQILQGETNLMYNIRPKLAFDFDDCVKLNNEAYIKVAFEQPDFPEELEKLKQALEKRNPETGMQGKFPEIIFLGTGSSSPSKVRNVTGILVHLSEKESMLLDVGEGSYGQIYRRYGPDTGDVLSRIKAVFISHMHPDHHWGLYTVMFKRRQAMVERGMDPEPIYVVASDLMSKMLYVMNQSIMPLGNDIEFALITRDLNFVTASVDKGSAVEKDLKLKKLEVTPVIHRQQPYGIAITHEDGWKLVYSGDTVPCQNLVTIGQDCDILIHEATMEDDLKEDAKYKRHSTTSQAIDQGIQMNAKFILLTHFSQRYAKVPMFTSQFSDKVGIAFDNMVVRPCDMDVLPLLLPALKCLFAVDYQEMEARNIKRSHRKNIEMQKLNEEREQRDAALTGEKRKNVKKSAKGQKKARTEIV